MQKPKPTPLHIMYPKDVTTGEMLEVTERLSLFPFLHPVTVAGKNQLRWMAYADTSIRFEVLDELAEILGAHWLLNAIEGRVVLSRKGEGNEESDDEDLPEAA